MTSLRTRSFGKRSVPEHVGTSDISPPLPGGSCSGRMFRRTEFEVSRYSGCTARLAPLMKKGPAFTLTTVTEAGLFLIASREHRSGQGGSCVRMDGREAFVHEGRRLPDDAQRASSAASGRSCIRQRSGSTGGPSLQVDDVTAVVTSAMRSSQSALAVAGAVGLRSNRPAEPVASSLPHRILLNCVENTRSS